MKTILIGIALSLWASSSSMGAELTPQRGGQHIGLTLSNVSYPESLAKDLMSGLENRVLIRVTLSASGRVLARRAVVLTVTYDLWLEVFKVNRFVDDAPLESLTLSDASSAIAYLQSLTVTELFAVSGLPKESLSMQVDILVNPVEREKIERLRKWVAANSAPTSAGGDAPLKPKPNDLFNTIFEQYIQGADIAAPWRTTLVSAPFYAAQ